MSLESCDDDLDDLLKKLKQEKKDILQEFVALGGTAEELGVSSDSSADELLTHDIQKPNAIVPFSPGLNSCYVTDNPTTQGSQPSCCKDLPNIKVLNPTLFSNFVFVCNKH